jgi:GntR family transcriptional regulator, arabinose operon transcriptional repressor
MVTKRKHGPTPSGSTKYEQLKRRILADLAAGRLKEGQALASEPVLAAEAGVARNTVRQALAELEREGILKRVQGKGTFVSTEGERKTREQLKVFAMVLPEMHRDLYPILVKGFDHGAAGLDYQVMVCNTDNDIHKQGNLILQLIDKKVAGVAMVPPTIAPTPLHQIRQLQDHHIPVVFCHRRVQGAKGPLLTWDWESAGRMAGEAFLGRGHRRLAYFSISRYPLAEAYEKGLRAALVKAGATLSEKRIFYGEYQVGTVDEDSVRLALEKMLKGADRPTGIFCNDDTEAELIYLMVRNMGLKVPENISIIGFGDRWRNGAVRQQLTSVTVDEHEVGVKAAELLCRMRCGQMPMDDDKKFFMELTMVPGRTLGPVKK